MVDNISTFLGLEISGVSARREGDVYKYTCPCCGSPAVTDGKYAHCSNKQCNHFVASGTDLVAELCCEGDYESAMELIKTVSPKSHKTTIPEELKQQRKVFNWWISQKNISYSNLKLRFKDFCHKQDMCIDEGDFGITIVDLKDINNLRNISKETGGSVDEGMYAVAGAYLAYAVQTKPNIIDRIVIMNRKGATKSFIWNNLDRGIISLADITPDCGSLIYGDLRQMLLGRKESKEAGNDCRSTAYWRHRVRYRVTEPEKIVTPAGAPPLVGIVRRQEDAVRFSDLHNHLLRPDCFKAATKQITLGNLKQEKPRDWTSMRISVLLSALRKEGHSLGMRSTKLLEKLSLTRNEGSILVAKLRSQQRYGLAAGIYQFVNNTILFQSSKIIVKSSTNDYTITKDGATTLIANFCLELKDRVCLQETSQTYYSARIVFDKRSFPITLSQEALEDPKLMERDLQIKYSNDIENLTQEQDKGQNFYPVITDMASMRKYVIPYLKQLTTNLPSVPGVDLLGWTQNKRVFAGPGMLINLDAFAQVRSRYMPRVKVFQSMQCENKWDAHKVGELPRAARDLLGMILSNIVRSYLGLPTKPIAVRNSNSTRTLLRGMFLAIGQKEIFSLDNDMSKQRGVEGIKGYPLLCNQYSEAQINASSFSHVVLGETGYASEAEITDEQIYEAGRSLQYALRRVVEWCLAESAAGFSQSRGFTNTAILLKEGKWIMEHVCKQQPWEVSNLGLTDLEDLMQQIDFEDVPKVMELHAGETLVLKTSGLKLDPDKIAEDLNELNIDHNMEKDSIRMVAATCMPAFREFYGKTPRPKNILKTV